MRPDFAGTQCWKSLHFSRNCPNKEQPLYHILKKIHYSLITLNAPAIASGERQIPSIRKTDNQRMWPVYGMF